MSRASSVSDPAGQALRQQPHGNVATLCRAQVSDPDRGSFYVRLERAKGKRKHLGVPVYVDAFGAQIAVD